MSEIFQILRFYLKIGWEVKGGEAVSVKGWGQCLTVTLPSQTFTNFSQMLTNRMTKTMTKTKAMKINMTTTMTKCFTVTLPSQTFTNFFQIFDKHKDKDNDNKMQMTMTKRMANASLLHFPLKPSPMTMTMTMTICLTDE